MERQNIVNKLAGENPKSFNPELFNKFSFLNKLNLMYLLDELDEDELLDSMDRDFNLIFVFHDILWKNVVALLKNVGVEVYGGSGTRRHVLSTVQANLASFFMLLNNFVLDNNLIYKSFNAMEAYDKKIDLGLYTLTCEGRINDLIVDNQIWEHFLDIVERKLSCHDEYYVVKLNLALTILAKIQEFNKEILAIEDSINKINLEIAEDVKRKSNLSYKVEKKYKV